MDVFRALDVYFTAATLGAHSNFHKDGFRQRDLKFLLGLFLNWMDATAKDLELAVHNTQIARYLDQQVKAGYASRAGTGQNRRYRLTRGGVLASVEKLTVTPVTAPLERFFFIHYFVSNYHGRLKDLAESGGERLPKAFQIELSARLNAGEMLDRQIAFVRTEIQKLEARIKDTKGAAKLARDLTAKGRTPDETAAQVSEMFPYDLNSVKPMKTLMTEIPAHLRVWELTAGNDHRSELLWGPMKNYLLYYLENLNRLKAR